MKIIEKKRAVTNQPAIDTRCDNCGAIYDLYDCVISFSGHTLCPDCCNEARQLNILMPKEHEVWGMRSGV